MSEYIKREDAIDAVRKAYVDYIPILYGRTQEIPLKVDMALTNIPSADVVERKRGEWVSRNPYWHTAICSNCNKVTMFEDWDGEVLDYNFCPNCGADMREREGE